jgi:cysteine desulfurase / selenocysteine lyase
LGDWARDRVASLVTRLAAGLSRSGTIRAVTPTAVERRAGILTAYPVDLPGALARLGELGAVCSIREGGVRLSPHCFNTEEEIDAVVAALGG